jgi:hypothetical protein
LGHIKFIMAKMSHLYPLFFLLILATELPAQTPADAAVPVEVMIGISPPGVLLSWPNPAPSDIFLRRRTKDLPGNSWTTLINAAGILQNGYFDADVEAGKAYEYALGRKTGDVTAYGYAYAALEIPAPDVRGKMLIFIDSVTSGQLGTDLEVFKNDLRGEGWQVLLFKTGNATTVQNIKNQISGAYYSDTAHVKSVLLMGNIPVPYSGSTAWDNRPDHAGAWPCDGYYGDVNGIWTDNSVNLTSSARIANHNVPGDGKFDQSAFPSPVELPVGRLDFSRLSQATFALPPVELLRRYLIKNHLWRTGQYSVANKSLVDDNLGWAGGEAFASDGFRNAYPLTGPGQVEAGNFLSQTNPKRFLFGYGAGASGGYSSAPGVGSSTDFAADTVQVVFASLFGDYFGDWDYEVNPLLPAVLSSRGGILACGWSGRPHWMMQGLAVGETTGFCLKETQNAQYNDAYNWSNGLSGTHVSLLGDPSIRARIVAPATNLIVKSNCNQVDLSWTASSDSNVLGYVVYRSLDINGPYARLTTGLIGQIFWTDPAPPTGTLYYNVRAVKLESVPGGGRFYNAGTGPIGSVQFAPGTAPTAYGLGGTLNCLKPSLTLGVNFQPPASTYQWYLPNGMPLSGFTAMVGGIYKVVVTAPNGCTVEAFATVNVDTLLPPFFLPDTVLVNCLSPNLGYTVPAAQPGVHYIFNGVEVLPGQIITVNSTSVFIISSTENGCSRSQSILVVRDTMRPGVMASTDGNLLGCSHTTVHLFGSSPSPVIFSWSGPGFSSQVQNPVASVAGLYCLLVTGVNGCTSTACVQVDSVPGGMVMTQISFPSGPCISYVQDSLYASATGGVAPYQYNWSTGDTGPLTIVGDDFSGLVGVTVTDANGCMNQASYHLYGFINVLAQVFPETEPGLMNGAIELFVYGGAPPYQFLWSNGDTTQNIYDLSNSLYAVTVTGSDGCTTMRYLGLVTESAGNGLPAETGVRIFPNPAQDHVTVHFLRTEPGQYVTLKLRDVTGRTMAIARGNGEKMELDTSELASGMYVLWVEQPPGTAIFKVMVVH